MESNNDITDETLPETEVKTEVKDGQEAVKSNESIKDVLSKELGKDFPSDEAALKAVKDTFSYVGKKKEDVAKEVAQTNTKDFVSRAEFEEATFYAKHPEYENYKGIISSLKATSNKPLSEVVKDENFKAVYDKAVAFDKTEKSKSILQTNPRLGQITDNMSKAKDAVLKGDMRTAKKSAIAAVLDAYEK
jgi:hypothetical protein